MKKVLISIPALYDGGAQRVVALWSNALVEMGHDVAFLIHNSAENEYDVYT